MKKGRMKKGLIFLLLCGLVLAFVGCASETDSADPETTRRVTLYTVSPSAPKTTDRPFAGEIIDILTDLPEIPLTETPSGKNTSTDRERETTDTSSSSTACRHAHVSVTVVRQPTARQAGEKKYTCSDCGAEWTEEIPRLISSGIELPEIPLR